jgi:hypothetical protein
MVAKKLKAISHKVYVYSNRGEMGSIEIKETSIHKDFGFLTYFFHTLIKQRQILLLFVCLMSNNPRVKTILILAANPQNTAHLRLDQEIREIDQGLRLANKREQYRLEQKWAVRSRDFYRAILDYQPNFVHFCGHGAGEDGIVLEDDTEKMALVPTNALASMFKLFAKKGVECVIINACYSEVQADAISQYVNYVIGMSRAVGDRAAVAFAVAFYYAIAAGYEVEEAFELGCSQMMSFGENEIPVLKKKRLPKHEKS